MPVPTAQIVRRRGRPCQVELPVAAPVEGDGAPDIRVSRGPTQGVVMSPVLITVFDGLQPAQVTPELMPNLARFASEGVTFANHHPVYPSVTRVNAASMVTGRYPGAHGLAANTLVVREMDPYVAFSALEPTLTRLKERTGRVLLAPTLADLLARHGMEYVAIGTGTTGNAFVHNPNADESGGATIHPEFTLHAACTGNWRPALESGPPTPCPPWTGWQGRWT